MSHRQMCGWSIEHTPKKPLHIRTFYTPTSRDGLCSPKCLRFYLLFPQFSSFFCLIYLFSSITPFILSPPKWHWPKLLRSPQESVCNFLTKNIPYNRRPHAPGFYSWCRGRHATATSSSPIYHNWQDQTWPPDNESKKRRSVPINK
jgi:hypothetical protein